MTPVAGGKASALALLSVACGFALPATAGQETIHWAYAALYGTGRYSIAGEGSTTVLGVAPGWAWREPVLTEDGEREPGFRFRFPVSIGSHDFSDIRSLGAVAGFGLDSVSTVSVVPGVDIEIPMTERWSLKTLGYLGYGAAMDSSDEATIFRLGFRSQLGFEFGATEMLLVNGLGRFAFDPKAGPSTDINWLGAGLDFSRPLENTRIGGVPAAINWHVYFTHYSDSLGLDFTERRIRSSVVDEEWELGFSFSKQSGTIRLGMLQFDRIGLAYRFGADGDFSGVGIVVKSLFDR